MNKNVDYIKYIKQKKKYIKLKNQLGGNVNKVLITVPHAKCCSSDDVGCDRISGLTFKKFALYVNSHPNYTVPLVWYGDECRHHYDLNRKLKAQINYPKFEDHLFVLDYHSCDPSCTEPYFLVTETQLKLCHYNNLQELVDDLEIDIPIKLGTDANFIMEECAKLGVICILIEASDSSDTHLQKLASASIQIINQMHKHRNVHNPKNPIIISTWEFSKQANEKVSQQLEQGKSNVDAVVEGIKEIEATAKQSYNVGRNGTPNLAGVVQLDAAIMNGKTNQIGCVAAVEKVKHPIELAKLVMENTPHHLIVGKGAELLAIKNNLELDTNSLDDDEKYKKWLATQTTVKKQVGHDTVALILLDTNGDFFIGNSTSGINNKYPGRVGDVPLIGSGFYIDNKVGAAAATGLGENIMKYVACFQVVENMSNGMNPMDACKTVINKIIKKENNLNIQVNLIAINKKGEIGYFGDKHFKVAITKNKLTSIN